MPTTQGALGRRAAVSSLVLLLENTVRLGLTAAVAFWLARTIGPDQFGIINFVSALIAIAWGVANFGIEIPTTVRLTDGEDARRLLATAIALRLMTSIIVVACLVVIALSLSLLGRKEAPALLAGALGVLGSSLLILDTWFKARSQAIAPSIARSIATVTALGLRVLLVLSGCSVVALTATIAVEGILLGLAICAAFYLSKDSPSVSLSNFDPALGAKLVKSGAPYLVSAVAMVCLMKVDVVLLGFMADSRSVGVYSLAQRMSEVLYVVPTVILDSAYPMLARSQGKSKEEQLLAQQFVFDVVMAVSIVCTSLAVLIGGPLIEIVFGSQYSESADIFLIHAWTVLPIALNSARHRWQAAHGNGAWTAKATLIALAVNFAVIYTVLPVLGVEAVAYSTLFSYVFFGLVMSFLDPSMQQVGRMQVRALFPWFRLAARLKNHFSGPKGH